MPLKKIKHLKRELQYSTSFARTMRRFSALIDAHPQFMALQHPHPGSHMIIHQIINHLTKIYHPTSPQVLHTLQNIQVPHTHLVHGLAQLSADKCIKKNIIHYFFFLDIQQGIFTYQSNEGGIDLRRIRVHTDTDIEMQPFLFQ